MSVIAPSPPEREVQPAPAGGRTPTKLPVLELLIASRPERERRAIAIAVAGAVVFHLVLIFLFILLGPLGGRWRGLLPDTTSGDDRPIALLLPSSAPGAPAQRAAASPAAAEPRLVTPRFVPREIPPLPAQGAGEGAKQGQGGQGQGAGAAPAGAAQGGVGGYSSAAEALKPHSWDRRLWEPPEALLPKQSDADRVAARVQGKLDAGNDSAAAVADAARKATDWTVKDKDGKSWGVTPGKLHLGDVTLPLPIYFNTPPGRRDDARHEQANWEAIQRSASQAEIRHTFDERVKAIRERKEKEHQDQQKKDETATTSP